MSWRTVVITQRCKQDLSMNYLEIRKEDTKRIHLSEIHTLIIDSTAVALTSALLCELMHRKIKVIFCDEKRNPQSELLPYYGSHDVSACIRQQIQWKEETKRLVWTEIVSEKIRRQQALLLMKGEEERASLLGTYLQDPVSEDIISLEGHAAKVYFSGLFGKDFSRSQENPVNAALNYGYSILLSTFNKEITAAGYLTQIGIFHDNMFNPFNLASDLMEPFRPLIDEIVLSIQPQELSKEVKMELVNILNTQVEIDGHVHFVTNAIKIYVRSFLDAMNEDNIGELRFCHKTSQPQSRKPGRASDAGFSSELKKKLNNVLGKNE